MATKDLDKAMRACGLTPPPRTQACQRCQHHRAVALQLEVELAGLKAQLEKAEQQRDEALAEVDDLRKAVAA